MKSLAGQSLRNLALDERVPAELFAGAGDVTDNAASRRQVIAGIVTRDRPTLRGLFELRRRGIVGSDHVGETFRDNLELPPLPPRKE
ncbi:hypothetical protein [Nocardia nova]|uniref:hypothetical protein n=1 Tax=Nocardia nova TaxID=37330 RepID=UPI0018947DF7|nr:hypothetical protein [Nocardia nova]MBF6147889.1 hypothetical protein [Nocardia nova]